MSCPEEIVTRILPGAFDAVTGNWRLLEDDEEMHNLFDEMGLREDGKEPDDEEGKVT